MSAQGGNRAVIAALTANAFIAATKFVAWGLTGAASMLAEAVHSVADTGNQILLLRGGAAAKHAATPEHPFGFGRARFINAFLVSVILFSLGGLFALYEAYHKVEEVIDGHPNELLASQWWWVPVVVLMLAIVAEGFSFRTAIRESVASKGRQSWLRFIQTAKAPELPVILLEDFAALLGLSFALVGVGMTLITHNPLWDAAGTALIGLLLIAVAVTLAVETRSLLLGESATVEATARITGALSGADGVGRVIHLKTLHLGPDEILVAAKIAVEPTESAVRVAEIIDNAEAAIRASEPMVTALYLEPDIDRDAPKQQAE
ncbi:MAG: cation diffusion facilitator family transporter [Propionibacteriaceae bacterium]|jgi:cation diffusion facilitator family transporter|nr:cation diffusion facilitator family transporter [Propionibacteriaceae bacterium]